MFLYYCIFFLGFYYMVYVSDVTDKTAQHTIQHTLNVLTFCRPSLAKV